MVTFLMVTEELWSTSIIALVPTLFLLRVLEEIVRLEVAARQIHPHLFATVLFDIVTVSITIFVFVVANVRYWSAVFDDIVAEFRFIVLNSYK